MKITVRYFASLREALGASEALDLPGPCSVATLRELLHNSSPRHADVLAPGRLVRCALNQVMQDDSALVSEGAEVAFFPPVTGG